MRERKFHAAYLLFWYTYSILSGFDPISGAIFRAFLLVQQQYSPCSPSSPDTHQVTSPILIVGNSCRKKNLEPCACYEFRIRAASAWGWSAHCEPVMVVTLSSAAAGKTEAANASTSPRQKAREKARLPLLCHEQMFVVFMQALTILRSYVRSFTTDPYFSCVIFI